MEQLNNHNPEYVTWKYEEILFALLGGIRIEGLHSMRVTLKVDFKSLPSIRHSLDLYNETQTEKLIKKTAGRFTLSTTYVHPWRQMFRRITCVYLSLPVCDWFRTKYFSC